LFWSVPSQEFLISLAAVATSGDPTVGSVALAGY